MIGLYAHHHGSGHLYRCRSIQAHLEEPSQVLSSRPGADVPLADDAGARPDAHPELTAGGTLHYAPYHHDGLRRRLAAIAAWVDEHQPTAFYVDVSVETAAFVRLLGVPVVTLAMPGARADAAHQLGYAQAEAIIAAWPTWAPVPAHLAEHADKLHPVGGISRLDPAGGPARDPRRVVVLYGAGGSDIDPVVWEEIQRACPDHTFEILGGSNHVADPTDHLRRAGVVVAAAGQNSVADLAVTGAPAVIVPQQRPFGEQHATAALLAREELAVVVDTLPEPDQWPALLARARALPGRWEAWQCHGAARRAADIIQKAGAR